MSREFLLQSNENKMNRLGELVLVCQRAWRAVLNPLHLVASRECQEVLITGTAPSLAQQLDRSAHDHYIEDPETRIRDGEQSKGIMRLKAYHAGVGVSIEISDNGAGVNVESIRRKAIELGLIPAEQPAATGISGYPAVIDAVRSNVDKLGGSVEMLTKPGEETTVKLHVPMAPKRRHQSIIWRPPAAAATTHLH
jgi:hypothetical protein